MKKRLLRFLACPNCSSNLSLSSNIELGEEVVEGLLSCLSCGLSVPIVRRIPRFTTGGKYSLSFTLEWNKHCKTQFDSHTGRKYSEITFFRRTGFNPSDLYGKFVLDAGCGSGRYMEVARKYGAEVIGVDASYSVDSALVNLQNSTQVHLIQADLSLLPLRPRILDKIYSLGVLHHTPHPQSVFQNLVRFLGNNGEMAISVYSDEGVVRKLSNRIGSIYRSFASTVSLPVLYRLCNELADLPIPNALLTEPYTGRMKDKIGPSSILNFLFPFMSLIRDRRWRLLDTFDYLSPAYQSKHTYTQVIDWFKKAGLSSIAKLEIPVSVKGKLEDPSLRSNKQPTSI